MGASLRAGLGHVAARRRHPLPGHPGGPARRRRPTSYDGCWTCPTTADVLARAAYDGTPGPPGPARPRPLGRRRSGSRGRPGARATTWPPTPSTLVECGDLATGRATWTRVRLQPAANPPLVACAAWSSLRRGGRAPPSRAPATSPTTRSRRSSSSPSRCSGRCCSRVSPAPARPRWPRRWPSVDDVPLIRLQCYEGIDATQALYDWDFPRQILHLRTLEAADQGRRARPQRGREVAVRRALPARPAGAAGAARVARRCCWSTRSTAPTTSSRRSCSRCSRAGR